MKLQTSIDLTKNMIFGALAIYLVMSVIVGGLCPFNQVTIPLVAFGGVMGVVFTFLKDKV